MSSLPRHTRVVIIGGGIIGCSVAYHLGKLGWSDVVLLERKTLTCGTTWHSGACIGQLRPTYNMTRLAQYTGKLLNELEAETGLATGYKENGALVVTASDERFTELKRSAAMGQCFGLSVDVLTPSEAGAIWPLVNTEDLVGAVFLPNEGQTNATDTTLALAKGAKMAGAQIHEHTEVLCVRANDGRVTGVETNQGPIECEYVVNCTGMWARALGQTSGVNIALQAVEHMYVVTEPMTALTPDLPTLRDHNQCIYYRVDAQQMLVGICEPRAKVWGLEGIPKHFEFDQLPEDWDHFEPYLLNAMQRVPAFAEAGIKLLLAGPESMTPDTKYLLGETPGLQHYFVATGFSGVGIGSSGGAGKALAEWLVDGKPSMDLWDVDVRRQMPFQNNQRYLAQRVQESHGLLYAMHWPFRQHESARNIRQSMLHDALAAAGACFGEVAGWEQANWYGRPGENPRYEYSYGKQNWFERCAEEHRAVRNAVGFNDLSAQSKFFISGRDSVKALEKLCTGRVSGQTGVFETAWLNEQAGVEALMHIVPLGDDEFMLLNDPARAVRDLDWLERHLREQDDVNIVDVSSGYALFALAGPNALELLRVACHCPTLSFTIGQLHDLEFGYAHAKVWRVTDVGEPSFRILLTSDTALGSYHHLSKVGAQFSLRHVGQHAWDSLQMEKSVVKWGSVIGDGETLPQARLSSLVASDKSEFIGARAHRELAQPNSTLVSFLLKDPEAQLYHDEPILSDGRIAGYLLTGMYGHSVGAAIGMGYLNTGGQSDRELMNADYEIDIAGERVGAKASLTCFYDAIGRRENFND